MFLFFFFHKNPALLTDNPQKITAKSQLRPWVLILLLALLLEKGGVISNLKQVSNKSQTSLKQKQKTSINQKLK